MSELGEDTSFEQRGQEHWTDPSPYRNPVPTGPIYQVSHVNQQVDRCWDGHSQSLVSEVHVVGEPTDAAHITRLLGLSAKLLIELVEWPEDQSADIEQDGEQAEHKLEEGEGPGQPAFPFAQVQQDGQAAGMKQMEYTATLHSRAGWCRYREVLMMKAKMKPAIKVSSTFSRPGMVSA